MSLMRDLSILDIEIERIKSEERRKWFLNGVICTLGTFGVLGVLWIIWATC